MTPADIFILASILQGTCIGLAILSVPIFRSKANNYLAFSILLLTAITFLGWQDYDVFWFDYAWSLMWEFLLGAVIFHYFLLVLDHRYLREKWFPFIYFPFLLILTVDIIVDLDFVFGVYNLPFSERSGGWVIFDEIEDILSLWYNVFLIGWSYVLSRSDTKLPAAKRRWLKRFSLALLAITVVWFLSNLIDQKTAAADPYLGIWLSLSLLFWWIAYVGVYRMHILDERVAIGKLLMRTPAPVSTVATAGTEDDPENAYSQKLHLLMVEQNIYRNPDLGRRLIAAELGISEGYVSQVMRDSVGEGLVEYVNGFRIRAAKEMLANADFTVYSLEAIGEEAGFKSRSAFYGSFKKATGLTPGMYRKQQSTS